MPTRKVSVAGLAGAIVVLAEIALAIVAPHVAAQIPTAADGAAVVVVSTGLAYLIPEKDQA